jgi:hypothetical protein
MDTIGLDDFDDLLEELPTAGKATEATASLMRCRCSVVVGFRPEGKHNAHADEQTMKACYQKAGK